MKEPKEITSYDFSETIQVQSYYGMKTVPDMTRDNFQALIDEHNNLVEVVNAIREKLQFDIDFDD